MNITKEEFEKKIIEGQEKCIVDFYANWCGPCKMMAPILENISKEHTVYKVNIDDEDELAEKYNILSIPCIVLFDKGKEIKRNVGFVGQEELEEFIGGK